MAAEWPQYAEADKHTQERLALAWMRRKRFEARLVASEVSRLFVSDDNERVPAEQLLAEVGIEQE